MFRYLSVNIFKLCVIDHRHFSSLAFSPIFHNCVVLIKIKLRENLQFDVLNIFGPSVPFKW